MYNDPNNPNNPNNPPPPLDLNNLPAEMLELIRRQQFLPHQAPPPPPPQPYHYQHHQIPNQFANPMYALVGNLAAAAAQNQQQQINETMQRFMLQLQFNQHQQQLNNMLMHPQAPPPPAPLQMPAQLPVYAAPPIAAQTPPLAAHQQQQQIPARFIEQFIAQEEANAAAPRAPSPPIVAQAPPPPVAPPQISIPVVHMPPAPPIAQNAPAPIIPMAQNAQNEPIIEEAPEEPEPEEPPRRRRGGGRKKRAPPEAPPRGFQVDEALAYLRVIKQTFAEDVPVYHRFLEIMKDFRAQRIDTPVVIEKVADLLYQSPDLVLGFNTFLPAGYRIAFTEDQAHYEFTSPQNQPRVLASPEERARAQAAAEQQEESESPDEPMESSASSDEMEEEELLVEEVVRMEQDEDVLAEQKEGERLEDAKENTLKLLKVLNNCFVARPERHVGFLTFMETYMEHCRYYAIQEIRNAESPPPQDDSGEGPAPKPREPHSDNEDDDEEQEKEQKEPEIQKTRSLEPLNEQHIATMLANVCQGEPQLLAATLQFMPHLKKVIGQMGSESPELIEKMSQILRYDDGSETAELVKLDEELHNLMEEFKFSKKEKLRVLAKEEGDKYQELLVLDQTNRVIYEHLKARTNQYQLKNLLTLMNMYTNMDLPAEDFVAELPRVMGVHDSFPEKIIRKMLGLEKTPTEKAESDPDAVMKCDVPIQKLKRGLREQKPAGEQVTVVSGAATVCTLGPSYRLMVKEKKESCEGRREMDSTLKEVLNDTWTSYPSWSSEEAGTTTAKKSNLEEFHYKTEDERYELDIIVDSNRTIIEQIGKVLSDMTSTPPELRRLDETLNCPSRSTLLRVLTKVYTNQVFAVIAATQSNPVEGLRKILVALKEKDAIWSKFQQETNRTWRDVLDKTMSANSNVMNNQQKQYDQKAFKSKPLVTAIEAVHEERKKNNSEEKGAHMTLEYTSERRVYRDVNEVAAHFFADLAGGKHEKDRSKIVLFRVLMDWVCQPQQNVEISTGSTETFTFAGDDVEDDNLLSLLSLDGPQATSNNYSNPETFSILSPTSSSSSRTEQFQREMHKLHKRVFYGDDNVYMIIRYHHMIVERFAKILATQAVLNQEHLETQAKHRRWQQGAGAEMRGQKVLEENMRIRQEAVNDIRNIRSNPGAYYDQTLREMKSLGAGQTDTVAFEEAVKMLFPGDVVLFNSIDKLLGSLAKNVHHATCADSKENAVKMYLKYRPLMEKCSKGAELEQVLAEYGREAEEMLDGKNTYKFEFVAEKNAPFCNIWVIPREEKEEEKEEEEEEEEEMEEDEEEEKEEIRNDRAEEHIERNGEEEEVVMKEETEEEEEEETTEDN